MEQTSASEILALIPAFGLALSDNAYTPNLIFRFKDKEREANILRANRFIFAAFLLSLVVCTGLLLFEVQKAMERETMVAGLEQQLSQFKPRVDKTMISGLLASSGRQRQLSRNYVERYLGMAVMSELSWLTPANIRLIDLKVHTGVGQPGKLPAKVIKKETVAPKEREEARSVAIEGVVFGDPGVLEATLAQYVMKLKSSPMFTQVNVQKNSIESLKRDEVLHFVVEIRLV